MTLYALLVVLGLLFVHWVADFVFQTHWQAINKSKRWDALSAHVCVYAGTFIVPVGFLTSAFNAALFVSVTLMTHFAVDAVTSRINTRLWPFQFMRKSQRPVTFSNNTYIVDPPDCTIWKLKNGDTPHAFFVNIGFDQWLHVAQLLGTAYWLGVF